MAWNWSHSNTGDAGVNHIKTTAESALRALVMLRTRVVGTQSYIYVLSNYADDNTSTNTLDSLKGKKPGKIVTGERVWDLQDDAAKN